MQMREVESLQKETLFLEAKTVTYPKGDTNYF